MCVRPPIAGDYPTRHDTSHKRTNAHCIINCQPLARSQSACFLLQPTVEISVQLQATLCLCPPGTMADIALVEASHAWDALQHKDVCVSLRLVVSVWRVLELLWC